MKIEYKITDYFNDNNLFDNSESNGLIVNNESNVLLIKGNSRDLVQLADILVNVAKSKEKGAHIHIDELTCLNKNSNIEEIIIEKE